MQKDQDKAIVNKNKVRAFTSQDIKTYLKIPVIKTT